MSKAYTYQLCKIDNTEQVCWAAYEDGAFLSLFDDSGDDLLADHNGPCPAWSLLTTPNGDVRPSFAQ